MADRLAVFTALFGAGQHTIADAGDFGRARLARHMDADARGFAVRFDVPLGRDRDQFAVGIAIRDVGQHDCGEGTGVMQLLAPAFDRARVGEAAHHLAQRRAVGVLQPEGARDLAHAGLAFVRADEGENIFA